MIRLVKDLLPIAAQDTFESRWSELPPSVRKVLIDRPGGPIDVGKLSRDVRHILVRTGLYTEGVGLLHDPPFFDWIRWNADSLPITHEGTP